MRHAAVLREYDPGPGVAISTLSHEYPAGFTVPLHAHGSAQLIHAIRGVMEVSSGNRVWVIPPQFAIWIPARTLHGIEMPRAVSMRTLYVRPRRVPIGECTVFHVSSLLRELILESARLGRLRIRNREESALADLMTVQLLRARAVPSCIRLPAERRALAVASMVIGDPGRQNPLARLCRQAGLSPRTLERLFQRELGCHFDAWRRQVRLTKAMEMLAAGSSVKETAFAVGYNQPSAFIEAFRRVFGKTPKAWMTLIDDHPGSSG
jgi:AraC-like DNA-binding protein